MNLKEDNLKDKSNEIFDDPDDILALLQDYSDDDFTNVSQVDNNDTLAQDETDDDLLALLDMISAKDESNEDIENEEIFALDDNEDNWNNDEAIAVASEDNDDIISIDDMWSNEEFELNDAKLKKIEIDELDLDNFETDNLGLNKYDSKSDSSQDMSNISDIFSNVLSAVDTLDDKETDSIPITDYVKGNSELISNQKDVIAKEKKESFLSKLFGKDKIEDKETLAPKENKEKDKKKKEKLSKKQVKNKKADSIDDEKNQKAIVKNKKKTAAKEKKNKLPKSKIKEANSIIKDITDDDKDAPINKKACAVVFLLLGSIFILILLGTNLYTYSLGIKYAEDYFDKGRYSDAYYEIYGVNLKETDQTLYDKIVTVMYVNQQLEAYMNYYDIKEYPKALDSLFKGLKRYEQYIDHGIKLGVEEDLNTLREAIIGELDDKFNITEKEAKMMTSIEDISEYSINVHTLVIEKMD